MRLFVSLRPSAEAVDHLRAALAGVQVTRPHQWHVTLAFLGNDADPQRLQGPLAAAVAPCPPLRLVLRGGGGFPGRRQVWAGVAGDLTALHALQQRVAGACRESGHHLESRRYQPHLTIGPRTPAAAERLTGYDGPEWMADHVEVVASRLGRTVEHTVLARLPLTGTAHQA